MLFKYNRHYGHEVEEQKKVTKKNPQLLKTKAKWFRRRTERRELSEEKFIIPFNI